MSDFTDFIDFKDLKTFIWVAELRSFGGAAGKLNASQPAVSTRIRKLEDLLAAGIPAVPQSGKKGPRLVRLLERDRRRIELMNFLLFSMPGTPVIYYGDELGMGDNIRLGDRDGVRTPMQWSPDRNGGFSRADPEIGRAHV